ncbi:MAG: HEAT repeat domain-containing protein [Planctomycetota bacterium]
MRQLTAILLLAALAAAEGDEKKPDEPKSVLDMKPGEYEIGDPGVVIEDSSVVNAEIARFNADYKKAKSAKNDERRAQLLLKLGEKDHEKIYKIATKIAKDKNYRVATAAVICIARQQGSAKKAGKYLHKLLGREKRTNVRCAAIIGLGALNYTKAYDDVKKQFKKDTGELRKASARYFGMTKAKAAFRMLAEELDEPMAKNPNDPSNPPASWWEARWHAWKANEKAIHWALSQLVEGESFETTDEAKKWAKSEGKKHGIEW